jgi:hypothetical protein
MTIKWPPTNVPTAKHIAEAVVEVCKVAPREAGYYPLDLVKDVGMLGEQVATEPGTTQVRREQLVGKIVTRIGVEAPGPTTLLEIGHHSVVDHDVVLDDDKAIADMPQIRKELEVGLFGRRNVDGHEARREFSQRRFGLFGSDGIGIDHFQGHWRGY